MDNHLNQVLPILYAGEAAPVNELVDVIFAARIAGNHKKDDDDDVSVVEIKERNKVSDLCELVSEPFIGEKTMEHKKSYKADKIPFQEYAEVTVTDILACLKRKELHMFWCDINSSPTLKARCLWQYLAPIYFPINLLDFDSSLTLA